MLRRIMMLLKRLFFIVLSNILASNAHAVQLYFYNQSNKTVYVTGQHTGCVSICGEIFHHSYTNRCCFDTPDSVPPRTYFTQTVPLGLTLYVYDGREGNLLAQQNLSCPHDNDEIDVVLNSNYQLNQTCASQTGLKQQASQGERQIKK